MWVSTSVMKRYNQKLERKSFLFGLHFSSQFITEGNQDRKLEVGVDAEVMEGCYLLSCFPWLTRLHFVVIVVFLKSHLKRKFYTALFSKYHLCKHTTT